MKSNRLAPSAQSRTAVLLVSIALVAGAAFAADPVGVGNFHEVDQHVYRGAQPSNQGFQNLSKIGVKTILDLRETDSRSAAEKKAVEAAGMRYINVPMRGFTTPTADQISKSLAVLNDSSAWPVFVHCRRGADRTGTVVACYRMSHDHWQNRKALQEAQGFGMSWLQTAMKHYVLAYVVPPVVATSATAAAQ